MIILILVVMVVSINREFMIYDCSFSLRGARSLYNRTLRFKSWPKINRFKKHRAVDHCKDLVNDLLLFRNKWKGVSGIYKITFLPFRLFTYYGSSRDLGARFKYHQYNTLKRGTFLGSFLQFFGLQYFSITVVELCSPQDLRNREDYYLSSFMPLLNVLTSSMTRHEYDKLSMLTRSKISRSLTGRKDSDRTRAKKSASRTGDKSRYYKVGLNTRVLDRAAEVNGTKIYAYDAVNLKLVNGKPFRSILRTSKRLPIGKSTLPIKLNTNIPFKGYYYYTEEHTF